MPRLELTHIVIHHTAAEEKDTEQIRRYHLNNGWRDIGYDFIIERNGKTVEGRSLSIQGAHAGVTYYNQHAIGVAVIGNLSKREIFTPQLDALVILLYNLLIKFNIPSKNIVLHREIKATECPGVFFPKEKVLENLAKMISSSLPGQLPDLSQDIKNLQAALYNEIEKNRILTNRITTLEELLVKIVNIINNSQKEAVQ